MSHDHHHHGHAHHHDHGHAHDHGHDHAQDRAHDHAHDHSQGHAHGHGRSESRLLIALVVSALFMLLEVGAGLYAKSLALIADAGHMLTDAVSLMLAYIAIRVARRPADAARSYGYERLQVLSAFVNGLSLLVISVWIIAEAAERAWHPVPIDGRTMLWVALLGVAVNAIAFFILHDGDNENLNMRAAVAHVLSDLAASAATVLAALVIL
ncbi:MAG TPA: cation diffusion facilitator family transporter, partial [Nevskiaceae bacterium]|nr:cation diffusion facilitator family transporter [Nevskiaceae bacterium]